MFNKILSNELVSVEFKHFSADKPYIFLRDKTDSNNCPAAYTTKIRGIKLAWSFMIHIFTAYEHKDSVSFDMIISILNKKFNLATHSYCEID